MKKLIIPAFSFVILLLILQFQNCSRVTLSTPEDPSILKKTVGTASLCLPDGFTLESFYVINMNQFLKDDISQLDSDADGLSDLEEVTFGFDPLKRRTNNKILDKICHEQFGTLEACERLEVTCTKANVAFGLNDCDLGALGLSEIAGKNKGVDSDSDGILDALEVLRGTLPLRSDALEDPDHDRILNRQEIAEGTDPNSFFIDSPTDYLIKSSATLEGERMSNCSGESWKLALLQVPVFSISEFLSQTEPDFSHKKNENIIWIIGHAKARIGNAAPLLLFSRILLDKDSEEKILVNSDFKKIFPVVAQ